MATLIHVVTGRLFNLVSDHTFPTPQTASVASYATSFIKTTTGTQGRNTTKEVLNCLRVLQRVLPVVFEQESECSRFEKEVLWKETVVEELIAEERAQDPQFVIEDEDEDEDEDGEPTAPSNQSTSASVNTGTTRKVSPSIAARLFSCLVDLLFCCGFTLPSKIQVDHYKINYTIWYAFCTSYTFAL